MRKLLFGAAAVALLAGAPVSAATFVVSAFGNSSNGGVALPSITLAAGDMFRVASSTDDLWSAGSLPRFSDANGLVADRFATAADDSGQPVGTKIGQDFGLYFDGARGFTSPYGKLVGEIAGSYIQLGANGTFTAPQAGLLNLFYWDSNNADNSGAITFDISAVPEPAAWAMMIGGVGAIGGALRRRRRPAVRVAHAHAHA